MSQEFLFEILTEEIPARMQLKAAEDLQMGFENKLATTGLGFNTVVAFITPRRLGACITGLESATPETREERRGPRLEAPETALQGFLKSTGLAKDHLEKRDGYWYAQMLTPARSTAEILPALCREIFREFSWPKSMRWHGAPQTWIRPVRGILAILNGKPLIFEVPEFGLTTHNKTKGHRFLSQGEFEVTSFADYKEKLRCHYVMLDHQERQHLILEKLVSLGTTQGYTLQHDLKLLEEVAGLSEYPQPLIGQIDPTFLNLPKGVLATSLRVHQKYLVYLDQQGNVAPIFGLVANTIPSDDGAIMLCGYERVLRARLSDARFFYEQDLQTPLPVHLDRLGSIVFHAKLGTLAQRVNRLVELVDSPAAKQAAQLCKSDLVTHMVGEFPELQGYMGGVYAVAQGSSQEVGDAIREHYQPQGPNDYCPSAPASVELALADKLDILVGFFAIGELPTGSKDPYALRRAALGLIRLLRDNGLRNYALICKINTATRLYQHQGVVFVNTFSPDQLIDFIMERLGHILRAEGLRHDAIAAVISSVNRGDNICAIVDRARTLNDYLASTAGLSLQSAFRRAYGILPKDTQVSDKVEPGLFQDQAEANLYKELQTVTVRCEELLKEHDYSKLITVLASLKDPIDAFFELKINDDDLQVRSNRLALLQMMINQTAIIADFSKLEG